MSGEGRQSDVLNQSKDSLPYGFRYRKTAEGLTLAAEGGENAG